MSAQADKYAGAGPVGTLLTDWSPSRLGTAAQCGLKFEYAYVRKLPEPYEKGNLLLGNAVHDGLQAWFELPDHGYRTTDLAPIVLAQWERLLPPAVWGLTQVLRRLDHECEATAAAILFQRPDLKSPRTTKAFLTSAAAVEYNQARMAMLEFCDLLPDVKWPKDEDPYKAYQKSAAWAANMQRRWQPLPPPLAVEHPFVIELAGFRVRGRIDAVRVDPLPPTGEALPAVVDYKTGRQLFTPMEAFLQAFIYQKAVAEAPDLPTTDRVAFYMARWDKYQQGRIDPARHERLASRILRGRARQIATGQFEPSYGFWCKSCDFRDLCEREISLWDGDGTTMELMA